MAIYGIGAYYDGTDDVSQDFVDRACAFVGWDIHTAPTLHNLLRYIKVGDIIYIKSAPIGQGLRVKAIGIVNSNSLVTDPLGTGIPVTYIWTGNDIIPTAIDKYNVRNNTLYEEFDFIVQNEILQRLILNLRSV